MPNFKLKKIKGAMRKHGFYTANMIEFTSLKRIIRDRDGPQFPSKESQL